jgi:membrane protease YdiL (CAAX protease family)
VLGCIAGLSLAAALLGHLTGRPAGGEPRPIDLAIGTSAMQAAVIIMVHLFLREHGVGWSDFLGLRGPRPGKAVLLALGVGVVVLPLTLALNAASAWVMDTMLHVTPEAQTTIKVMKVSPGLAQRFYFGTMSIVIAPLVEETIFRGILYPSVKQLGYPKAALFGTALLFAVIHGNLMTFVPLTFLAVVLALLYEATDNLLAPILTHSFFNAANFLLLIYETEGGHLLEFGK